MKVIPSAIPGVLVIEPAVVVDHRGFFLESFNRAVFDRVAGLDLEFVQDNHSHSIKGVLRGLHYQLHRPQGKLVRVVSGSIFDVAVDLRKSSPSFGRWVGEELSEGNHRQKWVPPGFAHGFLVTSDSADVMYKTTAYYMPEFERSIAWNDPVINIRWPLDGVPLLSLKDAIAPPLDRAETFA